MPSASAKKKTDTKQDSKAPATIKVPAALSASVAALAAAEKGVSAAQMGREKRLEELSDKVAELFKDRETAQPVLKQAFEDASLKGPNASSQRSRILTQAFPVDEKLRDLAKSAPIKFKNDKGDIVEKQASTLQMNAICAGSLAPNKKGVWLQVAPKSNRGASNKKTPLEAARKAIEDSATAFIANGQGTALAYFTQVIEVLSSVKAWKFDKEEAKEQLED